MNFLEAVKEMKKGKRVSREVDDDYFKSMEYSKQMIDSEAGIFVKFDDINATNWEIVEEKKEEIEVVDEMKITNVNFDGGEFKIEGEVIKSHKEKADKLKSIDYEEKETLSDRAIWSDAGWFDKNVCGVLKQEDVKASLKEYKEKRDVIIREMKTNHTRNTLLTFEVHRALDLVSNELDEVEKEIFGEDLL